MLLLFVLAELPVMLSHVVRAAGGVDGVVALLDCLAQRAVAMGCESCVHAVFVRV